MTCISQPISWLRLEQHALARDAQVAEHVAACPACKQCLDDIERDVVGLPRLEVPVRKPRPWWQLAVPVVGALAAAALILVLLRPRDPRQEAVVSVKGVGDVLVDVVRERAGTITEHARGFRAGDRFKVVVTCPPSANAWLDVAVVEDGARTADYPLAPAQVACGNHLVLPGAFTLDGSRAHRVCVRVDPSAAPPRAELTTDNTACVELSPE